MESQESTRRHQSSAPTALDTPGDFDFDMAAYDSTRISATSNARIRFWSIILSDSIVIVGSFVLALVISAIIREVLNIPPHTLIIPASNLLAFSVFVLPVALILGKSFLSGHYTQPKPAWSEVRDLLQITAYTFALVSIIMFLSKEHFSRLLFGSFWVFLLIALPFSRYLTKRILIRFSKWFVPLAVVGTGVNAKRCIEAIQANEMLGYAISSADINHGRCTTLFAPDCIDEYEKSLDRIETTLRSRSSIILSTPLFGLALGNAEMLELPQHDSALIRLHNNLQKPHHMIAKRSFDVLVSAIALILISPLMLVLYCIVTRDSGPFLYKQQRVGKNGRLFDCWKIRSMVTDSKERLESYLEANPGAREEWQTTFKLKDDPRVTRLGKFIRKCSIDELPQLWNVLTGDMSLVGPRPIVAEEKSYYGVSYNYYEESKPGITGLWQISGRNDIAYSERVDMDVAYSRNWSLWLDIVIILKTVPTLRVADLRVADLRAADLIGIFNLSR